MAKVTSFELKRPETGIEREACAQHEKFCGQRRGNMECTRAAGHRGWHIAGGEFIYLRWADASWSRRHRAKNAAALVVALLLAVLSVSACGRPASAPAARPAAPVSAPGLFPDPSTDGSIIIEC